MKRTMYCFSLISLLFSFVSSLMAQPGSTAVPFLLISPSTEANGMGGIMTSVTPTSSSAMIYNPAQLGMLSRTHSFSSDFYTNVVQWLPAFNHLDLWLNSYSMMYGVNLGDKLPNNVSVGIGYSKTFLNLGEFIQTDQNNPTEIGRFRGYEKSDNYSLGFSLDVGVIVGFGTTVKRIQSHLLPFGVGNTSITGSADLTAIDFGIISKIPVAALLLGHNSSPTIILIPVVDVSLSYAMNNIGRAVVYADPKQADPLPRTARVGWSVEAGAQIAASQSPFNFVRLTIAREAEDILATRNPNGTMGNYQGPLGDIDLYKGLIVSKLHKFVDVRRGFSMSMLETITYREGSFDGAGALAYKTTGITYSTRGLFRLIGFMVNGENDKSYTKYFLEHFEIRVSQSEYSRHPIVGNTKFENVVFSFYQ